MPCETRSVRYHVSMVRVRVGRATGDRCVKGPPSPSPNPDSSPKPNPHPGVKGPPRFACDSGAVCAMAAPQRLETIRFDAPLPPPGTRLSEQLFFELCGERMAATEASCVAELTLTLTQTLTLTLTRRAAWWSSPRPA